MLGRREIFLSDCFNIIRGTFTRRRLVDPGRWSGSKKLRREQRLAGLSINSRSRGADGNAGFAVTRLQSKRCEKTPRRRAEGFERRHLQEKLQFYNVARGSTAEVRSLSYVIEDNFPQLASASAAMRQEIVVVGKLVSGLLRSTEGRKPQLPSSNC
jgi:hypothetical protein